MDFVCRAQPRGPVTEAPYVPSMAAELDAFLGRSAHLPTKDLVIQEYLRKADDSRNNSSLFMAELTYLFFSEGEDTRIVFSELHNFWFTWMGNWQSAGNLGDAVCDLLQSSFLPACRRIQRWSSAENVFAFLCAGLVKLLEDRARVRGLVEERKKFFSTYDVLFDQDPHIFAFRNMVILDLRTNEFRYAKPRGRARKTSKLQIPTSWLHGDAGYLQNSAELRPKVWSALWGIFRRDGDFHPGDATEELGFDQDVENFQWLITLLARLLEGTPLTKCVCLFSDRGRNSKGVLEKCIECVFGDYYASATNAVFCAKKGDENSHDAAVFSRQGKGVIVANEVGEPWDNALFKTRNSRDKISARGCHQSEVVQFGPTCTYMFMTNAPPKWTSAVRGSERDRILPLRLPNKFVTPGEELLPGSPR